MTKDENIRFDYIKGILNTVILKDVVQRNKIRDTDLLERVFYFIMDNIGSIISAKKNADFLKSQGRKLSAETVYGYLRALEDALVIYKTRRFDIRGKRILETQEKYYLADLGFKHAVLGFRDATIPGLLENIVYLELKRRGFEVYVGKNDRFEVDFIAERKDERIYLQVAYLLSSEETIDREYRALASIPDHYPKLVLSMDPFYASSIDGVRWLNLENYLLAL
jgi:predicted AAA+ superfamily ATPase